MRFLFTTMNDEEIALYLQKTLDRHGDEEGCYYCSLQRLINDDPCDNHMLVELLQREIRLREARKKRLEAEKKKAPRFPMFRRSQWILFGIAASILLVTTILLFHLAKGTP